MAGIGSNSRAPHKRLGVFISIQMYCSFRIEAQCQHGCATSLLVLVPITIAATSLLLAL
jgi:hypothetical protein